MTTTANSPCAPWSGSETPAGDLTLVLSQPFTPELLDLVGEGIGPVGVELYKPVEPGAANDATIRVDTTEETYCPE